jgi:uncharacterized membrane protein
MTILIVMQDWLGMMVRWLHVVTGIAWIGSSFYFIALDLSLKPREGQAPGIKGETWQVHGGGFYRMIKFLVAPSEMPDELTWFKWEAYATWLSGFALLVIVYYWNAELFLKGENSELTTGGAVALSLAGLAGGFAAYEALCRSPLRHSQLAVGVVLYVALVLFGLFYTHVFTGRGAFIQIGALIGTIMVANVFVVIIPNQKIIVAELIAGRTPDPKLGDQGKLRSVHNNYLTLPVILLMISNHYPLLHSTEYSWLILALILALGPVIRHFFNSRHAGQGSPWWTWLVAGMILIAIGWLSDQGRLDLESSALPPTPDFAEVQNLVMGRCSMCHSDKPNFPGITHPPRDVKLDTPERIHAHAAAIGLQAAWSRNMPPSNVTGMLDEERAQLAAWLKAGAPSQ